MALAHKRSGFTLVEMLVVVAIIGVLVGLLIPAINMARGAAQRAQCTNYQRELGMAIISYEQAKQRLPGVLNMVNPSDSPSTANARRTNWVMALFSHLGRQDLDEYWRDGVDPTNNPGTLQVVRVDQFVCPSNKMIDVAGGLSYILNMGVYLPSSGGNVDYSGRLFRNRASTPAPGEPVMTLTNLKSSARTIMLSESLNAGPWNFVPRDPIQSGVFPPDLNKLAFRWPGVNVTPPQTLGDGLTSNHGGRIIVTFCDGHVETLPDTTSCWNDATNQVYGVP